MTIHCWVIAFLSADTSCNFVTWTFDLLTLNSCCAWRVRWPTLPPSLKTLRLSVLELCVITFPVDYHWRCVCGHCACAESRDPPVRGQKQLHFWNPRHWFAYSLWFLCGGGSNFPLSHWLSSSPLQHSRTTVRVCDFQKFRDTLLILGCLPLIKSRWPTDWAGLFETAEHMRNAGYGQRLNWMSNSVSRHRFC